LAHFEEEKNNMTKLTFIVQISVDESWIADGYFLDAERVKNNLGPYGAYDHEVSAKMLKTPPLKRVATLQGYKTIKAFKASLR
jgi:hypothetical protein